MSLLRSLLKYWDFDSINIWLLTEPSEKRGNLFVCLHLFIHRQPQFKPRALAVL